MDERRWSDLPADVLREISSRVWASGDFIYFHAVCKPWRNSHDPPPGRTTTTTQFLPWLLAPAEKESAHLKFRCVFSNACHGYRATPASPVPCKNWVCCADGSAFWYLTVEYLRPSLHDPLTGEVTHRPLLPHLLGNWEKENPSGVVYGDGSTFLYIMVRIADGDVDMVKFQAAILNQGGDKWMVVERIFHVVRSGELYASYHGGKIIVTVEHRLWHVITMDGHNVVAGDVLVPDPFSTACWPFRSYFSRHYLRHYNYLLEAHGELLWALVEIDTYQHYHDQTWRISHKLSLSMHALKEDDSAPKRTMRWVKKDGHSLADCVLFLGWPNSFVVDAARLGGKHRACAYLAYSGRKDLTRDQVGVYKFNLISNTAEFIERLPREWNEGRCAWIIPQPAIAPIQELTERRLLAQEPKHQHTTPITAPTRITHIERYYGPSFRALVRSLPPTVTSSQLQIFLGNHGKVSSAEVLYYKKTKRSQGIALITMSTIHANVEDAVEALGALYLHGCKLDIGLVKGERRRLQISSTEAAQVHV